VEAARHISKANCAEITRPIEIDQDNLHTKFSAFNGPSVDSLGSRRPAHDISNRGTPLPEKSLFYRCF